MNSDICQESYYSVMDHFGFSRTISSIISGNCQKFVLETTIDCSERIFAETFWNEKSGSKKVLELFPGLLVGSDKSGGEF